MTTVRTRVLRGPTGSPATTGQVSIRSPHDQTAPDGTTIAKGLAATITLTGGAMPGTDLPPGNYEVQLRINNTTRAVNGTIWFPIVVPVGCAEAGGDGEGLRWHLVSGVDPDDFCVTRNRPHPACVQ